MKKFVFTVILSLTTLTAQAVPNFWEVGAGQGFVVYTISNEAGQSLFVGCNYGNYNADNDVYFTYKNGKNIQNTDTEQPLSFLFDQEETATPLGNTSTRAGAVAWNQFREHIAKAKLIEVFVNDKKVATFRPNTKSIKKNLDEILSDDCSPMLGRDSSF